MLNYLNNNLVLINEYQNLYFQEINIDKIIERFRTGEIIKHNGFDYGRFRVFIDSCLLLLNKEKLNDYYKNGYSFKEFIREVENDIHLKDYFEFVLHELIQRFFNNYSSGLLFKNSFFSKYSLRLQKKSFWKYYFYEITPRICDENTYNGYNKGIMSELAQVSRDNKKLLPFLQQNNDKINVNELELNKIIKMRDYKKLTKKLKIQTYDEYFYGLKTFLDFETELSNFLVHISQINNVFYAYCTKRDSKNVTQNEIEEYKKQLEKSLLELYEDENAKISFKIGFVYLYSMNFALRTEDDDYEKLKYQDLNVSKFKYQNENWEQYRRRNETQNCSIQKYIVERMRNSLMHGHIEILLNKKGEIEFVFRDKYNKRNEVISIILEDLEEFLSQQCLYSGIPKKTLIFRVQQR